MEYHSSIWRWCLPSQQAEEDQIVPAPAVVGAAAVGGEGAVEIRDGEGGDAAVRPAPLSEPSRPVEIAQRLGDPGHQRGLGVVLLEWVSNLPSLGRRPAAHAQASRPAATRRTMVCISRPGTAIWVPEIGSVNLGGARRG